METVSETGPDWAEIERLYEEGHTSNVQLARDYGVSEAAIRKRAKVHGWKKNVAAMTREAVYATADDIVAPPDGFETKTERRERLIAVSAEVIVQHRASIAALRNLLNHQAVELGTIQEQDEMVLQERLEEYYMQKAAMNPLLAKSYLNELRIALGALSLNSRSKTLLNMSGTLDKLVSMERKAYKLDEEEGERGYEDTLHEVYEAALTNQRLPKQLEAA